MGSQGAQTKHLPLSHGAGSMFPERILKGNWHGQQSLVLQDMMLGFLSLAVMSWLSALRMASHALQNGGTGPEALRKVHRNMFSPAQLTLTNILLNPISEETTTVIVSIVYHKMPWSACLREQVRASWRSLRQPYHLRAQ